MNEQRLHTPDGVRDLYNGECQKKLKLQDKLHQTLRSYGYQDIQTPSFEFFHIFSDAIGTTPSKDLYKFFDKEGNTLVLRPDFTPSIARAAASYYLDQDLSIKLCYLGNTFTNVSDYRGKLKESTQCGAELIGDASSSADAEILAMIVDSLKASGLSEFKITVGHSMFLPALIEAAQIKEEMAAEIYEYLSNKNIFGLEELTSQISMAEELKSLFGLLNCYDLSMDALTTAKRLAKEYPAIYQALDDLESLYDQLKAYDVDKYISFELGIVSNYHYYTGIIFSGYTFGTGEAIVKGGRYDRLLSYFGKKTPAIGFAIYVDALMNALTRQNIPIEIPQEGILLIYSKENRMRAIKQARQLRAQGQIVDFMRYDPSISKEVYKSYADERHYKELSYLI